MSIYRLPSAQNSRNTWDGRFTDSIVYGVIYCPGLLCTGLCIAVGRRVGCITECLWDCVLPPWYGHQGRNYLQRGNAPPRERQCARTLTPSTEVFEIFDGHLSLPGQCGQFQRLLRCWGWMTSGNSGDYAECRRCRQPPE